jgi:hypothetical protein
MPWRQWARDVLHNLIDQAPGEGPHDAMAQGGPFLPEEETTTPEPDLDLI